MMAFNMDDETFSLMDIKVMTHSSLDLQSRILAPKSNNSCHSRVGCSIPRWRRLRKHVNRVYGHLKSSGRLLKRDRMV